MKDVSLEQIQKYPMFNGLSVSIVIWRYLESYTGILHGGDSILGWLVVGSLLASMVGVVY